jgi:hypothetical protein
MFDFSVAREFWLITRVLLGETKLVQESQGLAGRCPGIKGTPEKENSQKET